MDGWLNLWMDGWMDGLVNGWMDGNINYLGSIWSKDLACLSIWPGGTAVAAISLPPSSSSLLPVSSTCFGRFQSTFFNKVNNVMIRTSLEGLQELKISLCQPPLPQPLLPLESGLVPPCPPARWPTSGWRAAARSSPAWTRCPGSSICNNRQSLGSSFLRWFSGTVLWMHEDTLSINFDKQDGKWWAHLKSSLVKTSKNEKGRQQEEEVIGSTCLLFFSEAADVKKRLHKWRSGFKAF